MAALMEDHRAAADEFFHRAAQVTEARWGTPRADGKWTPAQEVKHVTLVYGAIDRELRGGEPMRLVGTPFKRAIWRAIGLTSILWRKKLPRGARAPREIRPSEGSGDQGELLGEFRESVERFEASFRDALDASPGRMLCHPYFGRLSLVDAIRMITVHTRHHAAVLPPSGARQQVGA
jgi:hypothetical protein